jgi:hypothetical protein
MNKNTLRALAIVAGSAVLAAGSAHAAIDTTAALAGVTEAQTAVLAVIGGMITMAIAVFGLKKVWSMFR